MMQAYLKLPDTLDEWRKISDDFYLRWNFPNCIGALDGKRFKIKKPADSGSLYFDYKKNYSIVLLALVDANCRFLFVDLGAPGCCGDAGIWDRCELLKKIDQNCLGIPSDRFLPDSEKSSPMMIVGDDAFPLKTYMMKPWPGCIVDDRQKRIFNYRSVLRVIGA